MKLVVLLSMMLALGALAPNAGAEGIDVKPRLNSEIHGRVIALDTGVAIPLATVQLKGTRTTTMTSPDGSFRIRDVAPGTYVLEIRAEGKPYRFVDLRGVTVEWTQTTNISMPIGLPRFNRERQDPLVIKFGDVEMLAQMIEGSLPPRLPAEKRESVGISWLQDSPIIIEPLTSHRAGRSFQYPWVHRLPMTREELRESHLQGQRLERAAVTWIESLRRLQQ